MMEQSACGGIPAIPGIPAVLRLVMNEREISNKQGMEAAACADNSTLGEQQVSIDTFNNIMYCRTYVCGGVDQAYVTDSYLLCVFTFNKYSFISL